MTGKSGSHHRRGETLLDETRRRLRQYGLRARKGLGQHFLIDGTVLETIVNAARLTPDDTVVEVGPGLGILTGELVKRASRVIAVELDDRLAGILQRTLASAFNLTVVNQDILNIEPADLVGTHSYKMVANLPYYIASGVVRRFLEASGRPDIMVVMVQKEVAEQIAARPGRMSLLSVGVQFYGQPEIVDYVPARCFYPSPEVDSAIVRISVYPAPLLPASDETGFFNLVRAGFAAARKQLANSLAQGTGLSRTEILPLLETAGIAARRRAESLSMDEWAGLWRAFYEAGKAPC
jgi:16S rRNA (adenine1518-N6/adenine1519-N6)-dimethyltransferase